MSNLFVKNPIDDNGKTEESKWHVFTVYAPGNVDIFFNNNQNRVIRLIQIGNLKFTRTMSVIQVNDGWKNEHIKIRTESISRMKNVWNKLNGKNLKKTFRIISTMFYRWPIGHKLPL